MIDPNVQSTSRRKIRIGTKYFLINVLLLRKYKVQKYKKYTIQIPDKMDP
jgi:hypothetical protein